MKKFIFTLFIAVLFIGTAKSQLITDFQNATGITIQSWSFVNAPVIGDDPADAANKVLIVQKDSGSGTFDQMVWVKFASNIPVTKGNKKLSINYKAHGVDSIQRGMRAYLKVYSGGSVMESWGGGTLTVNDKWTTIVTDNIVTTGVDSILFGLGGWDNGNNPPYLQGTYYIDTIQFLTPPVLPVVKPRKVAEIQYRVDELTLDGLDIEDSWLGDEFPIMHGDSLKVSGTFKATWDDNYLYVFINTTDPDGATVYNGTDSWAKDGCQLYFDVRNKLHPGSIDGMTQHQMTLPFGAYIKDISVWVGIQLSGYYADSTKALYTDYKWLQTSGGWTMEIKVPWGPMYFNNDDVNSYDLAVAAKTITTGDTLGFEAQINNWDATIPTPARTGVVNWSQLPGDSPGAYMNSGVWGGLKLMGTNAVLKHAANSGLKLYPNPVESNLSVSLKGLSTVKVYDLTGRMIMSFTAKQEKANLNVSDLRTGLYFIQATDNNNTVYTSKFIKK